MKGWYKQLKSKISNIESVKEELTLKIYDSEPMVLYKEDDQYLYVPHHYGKTNYGDKKYGLNGADCVYNHFPDPTHPMAPKGQDVLFNDTLEAIESFGRIVVVAKTGTGKTSLGLYIAAKLGKVPIVVAPTDELLNQWKERACSEIGLNLKDSDIGLVKQGVCDYKDKKLVIASMQSLQAREYDSEFYDYFGLLVIDELHKYAAEKMSEVLCLFNAEYQLGLTATLARKDGRDKALRLWLGEPAVTGDGMRPMDVVYTFVKYKHEVMPPKVRWYAQTMQQKATQIKQIDEQIKLLSSGDYQVRQSLTNSKKSTQYELNNLRKLSISIYKNALSADVNRNIALVKLIHKLYQKDRVVLGISDSIKQLQDIKQQLLDCGVPESDVCIFADQLYTGEKTVSIKVIDDTKISHLKLAKEEIQSNYNIVLRISIKSITINGENVKDKNIRNKIIKAVESAAGILGEITIKDKKKKIPKKEIRAMLTNKDMKIYLASYGVMAMGVDVPWIDSGVDLTPRSEATQVIGRIARLYPNKPMPRWFSPYDIGYPEGLEKLNKARKRELKKLDYVQVKEK